MRGFDRGEREQLKVLFPNVNILPRPMAPEEWRLWEMQHQPERVCPLAERQAFAASLRQNIVSDDALPLPAERRQKGLDL